MPRGGPPTNTYSLPAIYLAVPGTLITAAQHNTPLEDIAATLNTAWPVNLGGTGGTTAAALLAAENRFTATQSWDKGADIASAAALVLGIDGNYFHVTGTTTITSISTEDSGTWIMLEFDAALTLTHNATTLILPGGGNIVTAAGDVAILVSEGSGNWRVATYQRAALSPARFSASPAASSGVTFTGLPTTVLVWRLDIINLRPATDNDNIYVRASASGTPVAAGYESGMNRADYNSAAFTNQAGNSQFIVAGTVGNDTNEGASVTAFITNLGQAAHTAITGTGTLLNSAGGTRNVNFGGTLKNTTAYTELNIVCAGGNITSGEIRLTAVA